MNPLPMLLVAAVALAGPFAASARAAPQQPPRGPHPRIALTPAVLQALAAKRTRSGSAVAAAIDACRRVQLAPGSPSGYQGDGWAFSASSCALAYQVTRDKAHAAKGARLLRALLEDVERLGDGAGCVAGAPTERAIKAVRRDTGYAIRFIAPHAALTYDWLFDAPGVDDPLRAHARSCFRAWIDWYTTAGYLRTDPGANYHAGYVIAKTLIAIATAGEGDDGAGDRHFQEVVDDVFGRQIIANGLAGDTGGVPQGSRRGVLVGGDWMEGWQYGPLSVLEYAFAARALIEQGVELPGLAAWTDDVTLRFLHGLLPSRERMYVGGDFEAETPFAETNSGPLLATMLGPSGPTAAGWALSLRDSLKLERWGPLVFDAIASARPITAVDPLAAGRAPWFLARGTRTVYARSGWGRDAFWTVFSSPPKQVPDHQHVNASNFVFVRGADPLVVDPSPYGTRSSFTGNALSVDSDVVLEHYQPSQTPWSEAELPWARAAASGTVAARADISRAFNFNGTPSDVPLAWRDWVFLPEGELVVVDRVVTGKPGRSGYLRFRTPATLALTADGARGQTGGSALAIHAVVREPQATPVVSRVPAGKQCPDKNWGACAVARFPVGEYALKLTGGQLLAIHVLDGLGAKEPAAEVAPLAAPGVTGVSVLRAGKRSIVVAPRTPSREAAREIAYQAPGDRQARHVVFDAPASSGDKTAVSASPADGGCRVTLSAAGATPIANHPAMFLVAPAAAGCTVSEDPPLAMDSVPGSGAGAGAGAATAQPRLPTPPPPSPRPRAAACACAATSAGGDGVGISAALLLAVAACAARRTRGRRQGT